MQSLQPQASEPGLLYHDDFTDPTSGWPEEKFDNYFIGYHEPEYYHVEVTSPNYKTTVFEPDKKNFGDVTIEVKAFTASSKTAETGDFSFWRCLPPFRRPVLCLRHLPAHQEMVRSQEHSEYDVDSGTRDR